MHNTNFRVTYMQAKFQRLSYLSARKSLAEVFRKNDRLSGKE
jgi:hypothetical protein